MTCITNQAYIAGSEQQAESIIEMAILDTAIQVGISAFQRSSSNDIVNYQTEISDRQIVLAEKIEAHAEQFWPKEKAFVEDAFGITKRTTEYEPLMIGWDGLAQEKLQEGREDWQRETKRRCISTSRCFHNRWQRNAIHYRNDIRNFAAREDENRTEVSNDFRYAQQVHVLSGGRGAFNSMMSYWQIAGGMQTDIAENLTATVNSALNFYGYVTEPFTRRTGWGSGIRQQLLGDSAQEMAAFRASQNTRQSVTRQATQGQLGEALENLIPQGGNNG